MAETRPDNTNRKVVRRQTDSSKLVDGARWLPHYNAHAPKETSGLLTLTEAAELLGVNHKVVWALENAGLIDAMQRDGKGRVYYSEAQLRRVTNSYLFVAA